MTHHAASQETAQCPVCRHDVAPNLRYPQSVCADCASEMTSPDGHPVTYVDEPVFRGRLVDSGLDYHSTIVMVKGVRCRAAAAHFGGIVVVPELPGEPEGEFRPIHCACGSIIGGFCRGERDDRVLSPCPNCGRTQPPANDARMWLIIVAACILIPLLGVAVGFLLRRLGAP